MDKHNDRFCHSSEVFLLGTGKQCFLPIPGLELWLVTEEWEMTERGAHQI